MALKGYEIVREETARLARGMAPLVLIAFGILLLAGFEPLRTGVSLLAGTAYSILLFAMIGRSAARAVLWQQVHPSARKGGEENGI